MRISVRRRWREVRLRRLGVIIDSVLNVVEEDEGVCSPPGSHYLERMRSIWKAYFREHRDLVLDTISIGLVRMEGVREFAVQVESEIGWRLRRNEVEDVDGDARERCSNIEVRFSGDMG